MAEITVLEHLLEFVVPLASAGVVSMALVQTLKAVLPIQRRFQQGMLQRLLLRGELGREWLKSCVGRIRREDAPPAGGVPPARQPAWTWNDREAGFYGQECKDLFEKLRVSGEMAIDFATTDSHKIFYMLLIKELGLTHEETDPWTDFIGARFRAEGAPQESESEGNSSEAERIRSAQASKALIQSTLLQHLGGIQLELQTRWTQGNQLVAVIISALLLAWLSPFSTKEAFASQANSCILNVAYCLLGGVIAPFAKDLVTALVSAKVHKS